MVKDIKIIVFILTALLLASCNGLPNVDNIFKHVADKNIKASEIKFSDNYQTMTVGIDPMSSLPSNIRLDDTTKVSLKINDSYSYIVPTISPNQPKFKKLKYIVPDLLKWAEFDCLMLIDLCQPSSIIQKQHDYVKNMQRMFCHGNLYLAFMMPKGKVTNVVPATDYVIDNYINVNAPILGNNADVYSFTTVDSLPSSMQHAYLYRSVAHILAEAIGYTDTEFDNSKHKVFVVFSDGQVYNESNMPIDPQHFQMQEHLITLSKRLDKNLRMYYVSLTQNNDVSLSGTYLMRLLCNASGGHYLNSFNANAMQTHIQQDFRFPLTDYEVTLHYKKGNILIGNNRYIKCSFYDKKTKQLLAECSKSYIAGSIYDPIVIGDVSDLRLYVTGAFLVLLVYGITYIIMQLILPYLRYRMFQKRYVHKYSGPNMSVDGKLVADTCYYCKAPFMIGDDIVAACKHTMHLDCWEENGQHCPEHGRHCHEGSHYYNQENIFDPLNASYRIKWVTLAFVATFVSWLYLISDFHDTIYRLFLNTSHSLIDNGVGTLLPSLNHYVSSSLLIMQPLVLVLTFMLTAVFAFAASYHRIWYKRLLGVFVRGLCATIMVFPFFYAEYCALISCGIFDDLIIIDFVPWTVMTYIIIYCSTYKSRIKMKTRRMLVFGLAAGVFGAIMWNLIGMEESISQIMMTYLCLIMYSSAVAVIIAQPLPTNDHAFLHVTGEIKEMDIALYKWLKQSDDSIVTIGRSIDCSLQLSWDTKSTIAPVQAEIRQRRGAVLLTAVEGLVVMENRKIQEGNWVHLYHGDTFNIGTTTFTYIEM